MLWICPFFNELKGFEGACVMAKGGYYLRKIAFSQIKHKNY